MRSVFLCVAVLALWAGPASAEIRLIDPTTGASSVLVRDDYTRLLGQLDDGLIVKNARGGAVLRVGLDGATTPQPQFQEAEAIGPGGRTVTRDLSAFQVRAADGRAIAAQELRRFWYGLDVAWSADGGRVAVSADDQLFVFDTATGASLLHRPRPATLNPQAFAPDGSALVVTEGERVLRLELTSGRAVVLYRGDAPASWSATGQVAITRSDRIGVMGAPGVRARTDSSRPAQWSPDGRVFAFALDAAYDECAYPRAGIAVAAPGVAPRVLVKPSTRVLAGFVWTHDGRLAVDREADHDDSSRRGKRRPWPKRIARDYEMFSARGDAAMRRVVVRAARSLKRGAGRDRVMSQVRDDYAKVDARFDEAGDTAVRETVADELDKWLTAAGFEPIEALDEITC